MSANFDHHTKGPGGCQFSQWFWSFKVQLRKSIAGFRVKKRNALARIISISTNFFGRFGSLTEEILAEQVACVYMESIIWAGN